MTESASVGLRPAQVAVLLEGAAQAMQAELEAFPDGLAAWHPAPGEWCVKETLGHIIEAERRGFNGRIRSILAAYDPVFLTWDPEAVARERGDCGRDLADVLAEFAALRSDSVALVRDLRDTDLGRGGQHPQVGYLRIGDLLHEWVHHDGNHFRQMLSNIQAFVWPQMGNAQRFSQP
jgi:hypothetical protein